MARIRIMGTPDFHLSTDPNRRRLSQAAFAHAKQLMPGGVNSPARAFGAVEGEPIFFQRGEGEMIRRWRR